MSEPVDDGIDEEHAAEFFEALGVAVLRWQYVEAAIFHIFSAVIRGRDHHAVSAVFHAVANLSNRLGMIDAALKVLIPEDPALNEWERLEKKIRDLSQKRNFLVHYMLIGHIAGE